MQAAQTESRCVVSPEGSDDLERLDTEQAAVFQWVTAPQVEMYRISRCTLPRLKLCRNKQGAMF